MQDSRRLPASFMSDLKNETGLLHPLLEWVKQDNTLMLFIRNGYVNIYYRGGNLLRLTHKTNGGYNSFFDPRYNKSQIPLPKLPTTLRNLKDVAAWLAGFPTLKQIMDISFSIHNKPEREFQQLIARENNCSPISGETEYFITDIEFSDSSIGARFDLLAIRWLAAERKNGRNCKAALIEMKYGDNALSGAAGLFKHIQDINVFLSDVNRYKSLLQTMETQFEQLDDLGLLQFEHPTNGFKVTVGSECKPEVIFVLANHNPRSSKLRAILDDSRIKEYEQSMHFDLKFFVANFAGYGFHSACMLPLSGIRQLFLR
ncbi:hypothetical protein [Dehalococcoides sp.]|jgi:hypothetical protein|uniref:hypothetical protein n=1 Tax=Dehalococcoides sp. TaxID=1966486 RepID=UPI003568FB53